jgi:hypothetical protein
MIGMTYSSELVGIAKKSSKISFRESWRIVEKDNSEYNLPTYQLEFYAYPGTVSVRTSPEE